MNIKIERATDADLDAVEQLYHDLNTALELGVNYPGWKKGVYPVRDDAAAGIENHDLFVARNGREIVGSVVLNHEHADGYANVKWHFSGEDSRVLVIHTLAVHPSYSKSGIGVQLMNFAEHFGLQNNMRAIRLDVYEKNTPAIQLYERCGYQYIATADLGLGCYGLERFRLYEKLLPVAPKCL